MNGFSLPLWPIFAAIYFLFSILLMLLLLLLLLLLYLPAGPFTGHHNRSSASISPNPLHARLSHQPPLCPPSLHLHLIFAWQLHLQHPLSDILSTLSNSSQPCFSCLVSKLLRNLTMFTSDRRQLH